MTTPELCGDEFTDESWTQLPSGALLEMDMVAGSLVDRAA
jgi:hypothetical protein